MTTGKAKTELSAAKHILVVEDEQPLAHFLKRRLEIESYQVGVVHDGESALEASASLWDLVLLDLNIPKLDGIAVLQRLRPLRPRLPVLVLTGRSEVRDRVLALDSGADDCLNKPFSSAELLARVRTLLRRNSGVMSKTLQVENLILDRDDWRVERNGRRIELTPREFAVLEYLMQNAGRTVTRASIMETVWNDTLDPTSNVVDVYVKYVRDKVDLEGERKLIRTVRGVGYMLCPPDPQDLT